jgi:hypothetical protein
MKLTIGSLLALTTLVACMLQYRRATNECASLERELLRYEHLERNHTSEFRQGLEMAERIHRYAAQAPSPNALHGVVSARHDQLTSRQTESGDDAP